jgi:demethoxyubiquinone hydroxylase (CLK1/Coq7/Cat5 family)
MRVSELSRAQFLRSGLGGGVALVAGGAVLGLAAPAGARAAEEPSEADLATVRLAASAELLAQAFYAGAVGSKKFSKDEQEYLRRALANEKEHYDVLAKVLGDAAPVADDFEFAFPKDTFSLRGRMLRLGTVLETVFVGAYAGAAGTLTVASLQTVAAQIAASESQHLSVLTDLRGGSPVGAAFPQTFDVEQAPAVLDPFFGD